MTYTEFDRIRLDAFREIGSVATGNAATSLSAMLDRRVNITVHNVMVEALEKIPELFGGWEKIATVIHFLIRGQFSGSILLVLSPSETLRLVKVLTNQKVTQIEDLDEMGLSALKELGNIVIGSYIQALARGLKMKISYSAPGFAHDMLGAVLDEILARMSLDTEYAVIMESDFIVRGEVYQSHLIFILAPDAVNAIIKALRAGEK